MTLNFERKQFLVFIVSFAGLLLSFFFRPALEIVDNNYFYYLSHIKFDYSLFYFYYFKDPAFLDMPALGVHPLYIIPSIFWQLGFPWFTSLVSLVGIPLLLFRISISKGGGSQRLSLFFWFAWFITVPFMFVFSDSIALLWLAGLSVTLFFEVFDLHKNENSVKLALLLITSALIYLPSVLIMLILIFMQTFQARKKLPIKSFALFFTSLVLVFIGLSFVPPFGLSLDASPGSSLGSLFGSPLKSTEVSSMTQSITPSIQSPLALFRWMVHYFSGYLSLYTATGEHFLVSVTDNFFLNGIFYITFISLLFIMVINVIRKNLINNYLALSLFALTLAYLLLLSRMLDSVIITSLLVIFALQIRKIDKIGLSTKTVLSLILLFQSYAYISGAKFIFKHDSMLKPPQTWLLSYKDISKFYFAPNTMSKIFFSDLRLIPQNVEFAQKANKAGEKTILSEEAFEFFKREFETSENILTQLSKNDYSIFLNTGIHPAKETEPYSRARIIWDTHFKDKRYRRTLIINQ